MFKSLLKENNTVVAFFLGHCLGFFNPFIVIPVYAYFNGEIEALLSLLVTAQIISSISDLGFTKYSNKWLAQGENISDVYWNTFMARSVIGTLVILITWQLGLFNYGVTESLILLFIHIQRISLNIPVLRKVAFDKLAIILVFSRISSILFASHYQIIIIYWIIDVTIVLVYAMLKVPYRLSFDFIKSGIYEAGPIFVSNQFVFLKENTIVPLLFVVENPTGVSTYYFIEKTIHAIRSLFKPINDYMMALNQTNRLSSLAKALLLAFILINFASFVAFFTSSAWAVDSTVYTLLISINAFLAPAIGYTSNSLILRSHQHYVRNSIISSGLLFLLSFMFIKEQTGILLVQILVNLMLFALLFKKYRV